MTLKRKLVIGIAVIAALLWGLAGYVYAHGLSEPVYPPYCWVQAPGNTLWYPCDAPEVKIEECRNLMELAMKSVDGSALGPNLQEDKVVKLWERAKQTCWSEFKDIQPKHYH